jgi:DNA topoisomerase-2
VPFLVASGQFGTRAQGGKDFASPRYVFTRLSPITRLLFPEEDDGLLHYEQEDGLTVEPKFFVPVIPTLLLNGSEGIGTGWSTSVPTHHLPHVVEQVRCRVTGHALPSILEPYVVGFRGKITPATLDEHPLQYRTSGVIARNGPTKVVITELPVGAWTDDYKKHLIAMVERGDIRSFQELHSTDSVHFDVSGSAAQLNALEKKGLVTAFKLSTILSLSNMHAFDRDGKIRKYHSASEIVDAHYDVRRELYGTRKEALERRHAADELRCRNRSRFISSILSGDLQILQGPGKPTSEFHLANELRSRGFAQEREITRVLSGEALGAAGTAEASRADFGYLLDLPIHSLTEERSMQLKARAQEALARFDEIRTRSVEDLWLSDLDRISSAYEDILVRTTKAGAK